jgi:hypothetical protein
MLYEVCKKAVTQLYVSENNLYKKDACNQGALTTMRSGMIRFTTPLTLGLIAYIPTSATVLIRSPPGFTEFASSFK